MFEPSILCFNVSNRYIIQKLLIIITRFDRLIIIILDESNMDLWTYFNPQEEMVEHIKLLKPTAPV